MRLALFLLVNAKNVTVNVFKNLNQFQLIKGFLDLILSYSTFYNIFSYFASRKLPLNLKNFENIVKLKISSLKVSFKNNDLTNSIEEILTYCAISFEKNMIK